MAIVLGLMSKKGGAGKSTIVKLLSSAVTHAGHKCLVIDLDPNKDILTWWAVRVRIHNKQMTVAARAMAERKTSGHLSYRVATHLQSLSLPNMISMRLRRL
ncbi:ParA family protein [Paracoccus haeundaensis]|uniref:ParA family protein n=1 Tax=Paracoccus haeundaensis TaxID=225362 RepID=A0A5C4R2M2_9RHOB|nr:ParA family protein [Paracoccus haeundaensis]